MVSLNFLLDSGPFRVHVLPGLPVGFFEFCDHRRGKAFATILDEPAHLANFFLPPGAYQAVPVERLDNLADLYWFSGKTVEDSNLKAITRAEVEPPAADVKLPEVKFDGKTTPAIIQVRTAEKTYRFRWRFPNLFVGRGGPMTAVRLRCAGMAIFFCSSFCAQP